VKPEDFRAFLNDNGCHYKRVRSDGAEVWVKDGLDVPIVFYNRGVLSARELERLVRLKGEDPGILGEWRKTKGS
jgi:hypothetical protein